MEMSSSFEMLRGTHTLLEVLDVAAREGDTDFVDLGAGHGGTGGIVVLVLGDVTHLD